MLQQTDELTENFHTILNSVEGRDRIQPLIELAELSRYTSPDESMNYATEALALSQQYDLKPEMMESYEHIGTAHYIQGRVISSIDAYEHAIELATEIDDKWHLASYYNKISLSYSHQGDYEQALTFLLKALPEFEHDNNPRYLASVYTNIGIIEGELGNPENALENHGKAMEYAILQDDPGVTATIHVNIGMIYLEALQQYDDALQSFQKSYELFDAINDQSRTAITVNNIGQAYFYSSDYETALEYYQRALDIHQALDEQADVAYAYICIGKVYTVQGRHTEAEEVLKAAVEITREINNKQYELDSYEQLCSLYEKEEDYKNALLMYRQFADLKEQIFNQEKSKQITEIQTKHELEQMRRDTEIFRLKNVELAEKNDMLEELHREKDELLDIVAHDLKNPLTTILFMTNMIRRNIERSNQAQATMKKSEIVKSRDRLGKSLDRLDQLQTVTMNMDSIVSRLLQMSRVDAGRLQISPKDVDVLSIVEQSVEEFQAQANAKQIVLRWTSSVGTALAYVDPDIYKQILDNLVSNAVKYSPSGKAVQIRVHKKDNMFACEVQDQGLGLSQEDQDRLFGKFAQLSARPTGGEHSTGLGLYLTKKMVELMGGQIWATSPGKDMGSTFVVEVPES
ncbi:MAG: tetratricopeptide repeat-containing sensor histidine kinase [Chloroflexota bacterium]